MDIGVIIFPTDKAIQPIQLAKEVESRGFESLWFPEHSHIPSSRETPWGGRAGAPPLPEFDGSLERGFAALIARALDEESGDVLAFLPGAREIRRTAQALGLRSFQHLRMLLVRDLAADATAAPDAPAGTEGFLRWLAEGRVGCCRPRSPRSTRSRSTPLPTPSPARRAC